MTEAGTETEARVVRIESTPRDPFGCRFNGCTARGHSRPVLNFWSKGYFGPPARMTLGLPVCEGHMGKVKLQDLINEEGQSFFDKVLTQNKKQPADHSRTRLTWARIPRHEIFAHERSVRDRPILERLENARRALEGAPGNGEVPGGENAP